MGTGNSAPVLPSCTVPRPIVVVHIHLLTLCLACISVFDALSTAMVAMFQRWSTGIGFILARNGTGVKLRQIMVVVSSYARLGPCSVFACSFYLGVCSSDAAAPTLRSRVVYTMRAVVTSIHVGRVLPSIVQCNSLVRSCTWISSPNFSCWRRSCISSMLAVSVFVPENILCMSRIFIFKMNMFSNDVICSVISCFDSFVQRIFE